MTPVLVPCSPSAHAGMTVLLYFGRCSLDVRSGTNHGCHSCEGEIAQGSVTMPPCLGMGEEGGYRG